MRQCRAHRWASGAERAQPAAEWVWLEDWGESRLMGKGTLVALDGSVVTAHVVGSAFYFWLC